MDCATAVTVTVNVARTAADTAAGMAGVYTTMALYVEDTTVDVAEPNDTLSRDTSEGKPWYDMATDRQYPGAVMCTSSDQQVLLVCVCACTCCCVVCVGGITAVTVTNIGMCARVHTPAR
jgi:hypothetical protein